jgi:hypothetical protein
VPFNEPRFGQRFKAGVRAQNQKSCLKQGHGDTGKHAAFILVHLDNSIKLYRFSKQHYERKFSKFAKRNRFACNPTTGKKNYANVQDEMKAVLEQTELLCKELTQLIDEDTEAFNPLMAAFGLPKGTEAGASSAFRRHAGGNKRGGIGSSERDVHLPKTFSPRPNSRSKRKQEFSFRCRSRSVDASGKLCRCGFERAHQPGWAE